MRSDGCICPQSALRSEMVTETLRGGQREMEARERSAGAITLAFRPSRRREMPAAAVHLSASRRNLTRSGDTAERLRAKARGHALPGPRCQAAARDGGLQMKGRGVSRSSMGKGGIPDEHPQ
jgi:hypothetical protein